MEEKILYPGEDVPPIEVGEGYREYWLSDVWKPHGAFVKVAKIGVHWRDGWAACELKIGRIVEGQWEFLWRGDITTPVGFVVHPEARKFVKEERHNSWTDIRLRYTVGDGGILYYPNFVAARHIWDYEKYGKHVDAFVDFATGEHYWNISST